MIVVYATSREEIKILHLRVLRDPSTAKIQHIKNPVALRSNSKTKLTKTIQETTKKLNTFNLIYMHLLFISRDHVPLLSEDKNKMIKDDMFFLTVIYKDEFRVCSHDLTILSYWKEKSNLQL